MGNDAGYENVSPSAGSPPSPLARWVFFWGSAAPALLQRGAAGDSRRAPCSSPATGCCRAERRSLSRQASVAVLAVLPSAHLFGAANRWAVRLPSALAASVVAVLAYRYALRQFGPWPALFAVQILIANTSFAMDARPRIGSDAAHRAVLLVAAGGVALRAATATAAGCGWVTCCSARRR